MTDRAKVVIAVALGAAGAWSLALYTRRPNTAADRAADGPAAVSEVERSTAANRPLPRPPGDVSTDRPTEVSVSDAAALPGADAPRQVAVPRSHAGDAPAVARHRSKVGDTGPVAPDARDALAGVGFDPWAEAVWSAAINDPTVPADERKNLIEDLNEDGFPDPHNLSDDDVPLILSRLALIAAAAPDAMDGVNADAFAEAYKDLANMLDDPHPK